MFRNLKGAIKRMLLPLVMLLLIITSLFTIFFVLIFSKNRDSLSTNMVVYSLLLFVLLLISIFIFLQNKQSNYRNNLVDRGINHYIENYLSKFSIGIIFFGSNGNIIWTSEFIKDRFGEKIMNENIVFFNEEINLNKRFIDFKKIFKFDNFVYEITFISKEATLILKDVTQEYLATNFYELEKLVIGEVEIDNYQLLRVSFSEEDMFRVQVFIINLLDKLSKKYNFIFKQYVDGKFLILTNRDNLNKIISNEFKEFEQLNDLKVASSKISLSIGFGTDTSSYSKLLEMSKEALFQSQTRGGDQITVISAIEKPKRFGSKSEISVLKSRTKIKNISNNFKIKIQDPKIKNVIIYGHKFADLDSIGASYALYEIAKSFNKKAFIQNVTFDETGQKAIDKYIKNPGEIFVSRFKLKSLNMNETLIIIVDCAEETRVENQALFKNVKGENVFIFDHHRVSKLNEIIDNLNIYIESTASSTCEMITEMIKFNDFNKYISKLGAQFLLNGIYLDTNQFRKAVSSRTFAAASLLESWGANVDESISLLKISSSVNEKIIKIVSNAKEIKPGYWLSYTNEIIPIDVISMGADEILKIEGRKASFVVAQLPMEKSSEHPIYKLSARSIGVNVQLIAEAVGGGGHFNAAAAVSDQKANETLDNFIDNIIQAIVSSKE